jgi:hypothetical protein
METVDERSLKQKWTDFKWQVEQKWMDTKRWCREHPTEAVGLGSAGLGIGTFLIKKGIRSHEINKEWKLTQCRHYDNRTAQYWYSRRPLKTSEKLKLDELYNKGMSKGEALRQMGLLK